MTDVCGHGCVTSRGPGLDMDQPLGTEAIHQADRRGRSQSRLKRSILHVRKSLCERSSDLCRNINTKTRSRTYNQRDASPSCTIARELCAGAQLSWLGWARGGLPEGADALVMDRPGASARAVLRIWTHTVSGEAWGRERSRPNARCIQLLHLWEGQHDLSSIGRALILLDWVTLEVDGL